MSSKVHPSVLARRQWKKFGDSASLPPGPDANSTSFAETVHLNLSFNLSANAQSEAQQDEDPLKKAANLSILCRICKGNHFSSKCPYKDTYQPLDVISSTLEQVKESGLVF